ncbi:nicotinate (nicotinamide) nucleotide adenylyltransferase [Ruminococcus sp.]|uniref:nicotinate (nicotinamide) nucleotide adenylyltransferase n=1 Tax=Ruminococcus sp. TaxID=41978 RepID=UPI00307E5A77
MSRIGILGGTFNPIHNGHIQMAKYSHDAAKLDKVILMPTFVPPHKESTNLVSCEHRFNMCRLASAELPYVEVSDFEIKLEGKSYTYRTLQLLKSQNENDDFYFIVGADMFLSMQNWKNPEIIFRLATVIAIPRDDDSVSELKEHYDNVLKKMGAKAIILNHSVLTVSSTYVRDNIDNGAVLENLIDSRIFNYIKENNLYRV